MKKAVNILGLLLTVVSVYFLIVKYKELNNRINVDIFSYPLSFLALPLLYAFVGALLALAWRNIISVLSGKISVKNCLAIYGISQIGKYVPGNIFHYIGKQMLGITYGIPAKALAKSQLSEIILQLFSSLGFVAFIAYNYLFHSLYPGSLLSLIAVTLVILMLIGFYDKKLLPAFILYTLFLYALGALFTVVIDTLTGHALVASQIPLIICAFATAWLAGFLVPGAPAGIGIRESALIILLTPYGISENIVFSAAILTRIITVCGDFVFFLIALVLHSQRKEAEVNGAS